MNILSLVHRARLLAGVIAIDLPRYAALLSRPGYAYQRIRNRHEVIERGPGEQGVRCLWKWTSDLHAPKHLRWLGRWLMRRALTDHPIRFSARPARASAPDVTFIIGHRGEERVPLLEAVLHAIAAQEHVSIECIVVQQEQACTLQGRLPSWVSLIHTPPSDADLGFSRSWAFNVGARHAHSPVLVLHDNDMLPPVDYASRIVRCIQAGYQVVNLKRFIFYLDKSGSERILTSRPNCVGLLPLDAIIQNAEGGGSIAITASAFDAIGGMDESFAGWGGEDTEFWERASVLKVWPWGDLPLVHLWHPAQPGKHETTRRTARLYRIVSASPGSERVARLRDRPRGRLEGPFADPELDSVLHEDPP